MLQVQPRTNEHHRHIQTQMPKVQKHKDYNNSRGLFRKVSQIHDICTAIHYIIICTRTQRPIYMSGVRVHLVRKITMKHSQKLKLGRKMMSKSEKATYHIRKEVVEDESGRKKTINVKYKQKTSPFDSVAWRERKRAIEKRVERKITKAKELAEKKRQAKKQL